MKNKMTKFYLILAVFILGFGHTYAQTKRDSSNAEIKQQALEMRVKLNKYLADNLLEEGKKDTGLQVFIDSISHVVSKQQKEINELNEKLNTMFKLVQSGDFEAKSSSSQALQQNLMVREVVKGKSYHIVNQNQLNLYFAFDSDKLSKEQILVLKNFIKSKKAKSLSLAGFTDWMGSEQYNQYLALNRANAVKKQISNLGLNIEILSNTICNNNSVYNDHTAKWCRRVEIIIR